MEAIWQKRVENAVQQTIEGNIFAGFNTNVDVVVHLNDQSIQALLVDDEVTMEQVCQLDVNAVEEIRTKTDFVAVIKDCLGKGKSFYIVLETMALLDWLDERFVTKREIMGGQAGIIANQMAALKANSIVYTSLLSPKQAEMFFPEVLYPVVNAELKLTPVQESAKRDDSLKINWIFEYAKGEVFNFGDEQVVTPRANRVILATRPDGVAMDFAGDVAKNLPELGKNIDVAFMAGYHYAPTASLELQQYLDGCLESIRQLKIGNEKLRLHFEYVPMKDQEAEKQMLQTVAQEIQSFGINENEICRVLEEFGFEDELSQIEENERGYALYQGALRIQEKLGFERIQVHNLGYYVLVLKKPYPSSVEQVRNACLYASSVNAMKAKNGGYVRRDQVPEAASMSLSEIGIKQLEEFAQEVQALGLAMPANFVNEGIWEREDHYVLVVPAHVVSNPVSTVGMGDTISSSSYACESVSMSLVK